MAAEYVHQMDALEYLKTLPDASVDAVITDPPYFRVKGAAWDRQWADRATFLQWVGGLAAEWRRVLVPNGSLYCFASPQLAARVEVAVEDAGFVILNNLTWVKPNNTVGRASRDALTQFHTADHERIVFAQPLKRHNGERDALRAYANAQHELARLVYAPIREYLAGERDRAGWVDRDIDKALGCNGMAGHWFGGSQWCLPSRERYAQLQHLFNGGGDYDYLRRDYEDLRRDYEDLRRPFNLGSSSTSRPAGGVWSFGMHNATDKNRHICQKPLPLLRHMIETSTRPDALILDSFAGSGSTGVAAVQLGRRFVGTELDPEWAQRAEAAIQAAADPAQPPLF